MELTRPLSSESTKRSAPQLAPSHSTPPLTEVVYQLFHSIAKPWNISNVALIYINPIRSYAITITAATMTLESIYKVDFEKEDVGKLRKKTKQRLTWTFQLNTAKTAPSSVAAATAAPVPDVIPQDLLGGDMIALPPAPSQTPPAPPQMVTRTDNQTHSVSLIWSIHSGEQRVEMDGDEVWFGRKQGASVFSHKWTTPDGLLRFEILASSTAPKRNVAPGFRPHDLMINGRAFDELPSSDGSSGDYMDEAISTLDLPKSIVDILYPEGYTEA